MQAKRKTPSTRLVAGGRAVSMPCQNVLDGFHPFVSLLLPDSLSFSVPHHQTQRFSINCFIFLGVCVAEVEKFRPL
jgi:hypothetical protein